MVAPNSSSILSASACLAAVASLFLPAAAWADAAQCTAITDDTARLACYDRETGRRAAPQTSAAPGEWSRQSAPSLLAGHTNHVISLSSEATISCRWSSPRPVKLNIRCKDNVTAIGFETGCYMTSSQYRSYGYVTYQLDEQRPRIAHMVASPDNHALGFWSGDAAIPYIRELLGRSRLSVRMTPYAEDPIAASFDLRNLEEAIKPVRQECGW